MHKQAMDFTRSLWILGMLVVFSPFSLKAECCGSSKMKDSKENPKEAAFQALQQDFARLKAIHKQQPDNQKALEKASLLLKTRATTLRAALGPQPSPTEQPAKTATPNGPVKPSQTPSSPEEIQKRIEATEGQFLSAPLEDNRPVSLVGIPKQRLISGCDQIQEQINLLIAELQNEPLKDNRIRRHLALLEKQIRDLGTPPAAEESSSKKR